MRFGSTWNGFSCARVSLKAGAKTATLSTLSASSTSSACTETALSAAGIIGQRGGVRLSGFIGMQTCGKRGCNMDQLVSAFHTQGQQRFDHYRASMFIQFRIPVDGIAMDRPPELACLAAFDYDCPIGSVQ